MTLDEERAKGTDATKRLAKAAHEWLELQKQHYAEMERATMALNKVQTYQTQLVHYKSQEAATVSLIKKLKEERQAARPKWD